MAKTTARNKIMDYLARRDHSELELRQKLKGKFEPNEIEIALTYAKDSNWIPNSEESKLALSNKAAQELHRRKKGILYINNFLIKKGLPEISADYNLELEKALQLVKNKPAAKFTISKATTRLEKEKIKATLGRFLASRGFEMNVILDVIRKTLYEK